MQPISCSGRLAADMLGLRKWPSDRVGEVVGGSGLGSGEMCSSFSCSSYGEVKGIRMVSGRPGEASLRRSEIGGIGGAEPLSEGVSALGRGLELVDPPAPAGYSLSAAVLKSGGRLRSCCSGVSGRAS
jgi:hypothetical protein